MTEEAHPDALPAGYRLHWYVIERVLGQGGFGITYLAKDTNLDRRVAIKEYLPTEIARRRSDASARPHSESQAERYAWGLERFLVEARTLAQFDHPNIVRVHSVFEANNTAYMVMRFEEGENLASLLARCSTLTERQLTDCLLPILDGLQLVHAAGFIHRDIKPENIYVRQDGSPVLLDFGSARRSFGSAKTMTILVAPGYAPLEQYYGDAATQGAWTDIYGLGATCYRAIAGRPPLDAVVRAKGVLGSAREVLPPAVEVGRGRYHEGLLAAVDHALQLNERERPQTIADWRRELVAPLSPSALAAATSQPVPAALASHPAPAAVEPMRSLLRSRRLWATLATTGAVAGVVVAVWPTQKTTTAKTTPAPLPPLPTAASNAADLAAKAEAPAPPVSLDGPGEAASAAPKVVTLAPPIVRKPGPSDPPPRAVKPSPRVVTPPPPDTLPQPAPVVLAPPSAPSSAPQVTAPVESGPAASRDARDGAAVRSASNERIDAAEAALRRGDHAAAAQVLAPLAAAGVTRAQALLGRVQEERSGPQHSDLEAYMWYGIAARGGEPGARAMKDKVATKLQPAEIQQADHTIESWKAHGDPKVGARP